MSSIEDQYAAWVARSAAAEAHDKPNEPEIRFALVVVAYPADQRPSRSTITSGEWAYVRSGLDQAGARAIRDTAEEQVIQPFTGAEEVAAIEEADLHD